MSNKSTNHKTTNTHNTQSKKSTIGSKSNSYSHNSRKVQNEVKPNYMIIPIFIILCIIPLLVRLKVYNTNFSQFQWFSDKDSFSDFFLYYKQWAFVSAAGIMAIIIAYKAYADRRVIRMAPIFIPLAMYGFLALLSAIFSKYASFSFSGSFELFESVFAILGYCIVAYYSFLFIGSEKDLQKIVKYIIVIAIIMSILGIFQYLGHDLFGSKAFYKLIVPAKYQSESGLGFQFETNRVYLTLYNPNYVGVYVALVAPIILVMLFFQKNIKYIVLSIFALIGLLTCTIGAQSLSGIIGLGVTVACILLFMWRYLLKRYYITIPTVLILIIGVVVLNIQTDQLLVNKLTNMFKSAKADYALTAMDTEDNYVTLTYNDNKLFVQYSLDENQLPTFALFDENNQIVPYLYNDTTASFDVTDERFAGISVGESSEYEGIFYIQESGQQWLFTNQVGDQSYYHVNRMGKLDKMVTAPSAVFTGYEWFATARGYIWSRTIPIMKDYLFLGSGADTFSMVYPQQDYVNFQRYGYGNGIITKPHNLYLQMGVQNGILSLIAFLVFYSMYFISSIRLYIKGRFNSYYAQIGVAIFIGTIGYMATGLTNDSSITTAPMFWVLMGIGIAVNYIVKPMILEETDAFKKKKADVVKIEIQNKQ